MGTEPPDLGSLFNIIPAIIIHWGNIGLVFLLILLLISSALISGSEVAFFSLDSNDMDELRKEESRNSKRLVNLKDKPRSLLATVLISNNFINIAIIILSDQLISRILPDGYFDQFSRWLQEYLFMARWSVEVLSRATNFLITVIGVTFLLVLIGEVLPKIYANINKLKFARFMTTP